MVEVNPNSNTTKTGQKNKTNADDTLKNVLEGQIGGAEPLKEPERPRTKEEIIKEFQEFFARIAKNGINFDQASRDKLVDLVVQRSAKYNDDPEKLGSNTKDIKVSAAEMKSLYAEAKQNLGFQFTNGKTEASVEQAIKDSVYFQNSTGVGLLDYNEDGKIDSHEFAMQVLIQLGLEEATAPPAPQPSYKPHKPHKPHKK